MSKTQNPPTPHAGAAPRPDPALRWKAIVQLGQRLMEQVDSPADLAALLLPQEQTPVDASPALDLPTISSCCPLADAASQILDAQVVTWFSLKTIPAFILRQLTTENESLRLPGPQPESGWMQQAFEEGRSLALHQLEDDTWEESAAPLQAQVLVAPLFGEQNPTRKVLGVIQALRPRQHPFSPIDFELLQGLADQVSLALQAALRMALEHHRAGQLAAISEVSNAITSVLDTERLLEEVSTLIRKRFGYPFVHVYTVNPARQEVVYEAGSGQRSQFLKQAAYTLGLGDTQGIVPWVARQGQTALVNDVTQDGRYRSSPLPPFTTRSELTVPLIFGGEVLGVLDVQSDQVDVFGEEDRFLFETLADHIAIAMRNANLYRTETWRRQVADSLHDVAGLLSADVGLSQVLKAILTELERNLPCDLASIWLLDEDVGANGAIGDAIGTSNGPNAAPGRLPPLRLAAVHGPMATGLNLAEGLDLRSFIECGVEEIAADSAAASDTLNEAAFLVEALRADVPVIRSPGSSRDPLGIALDFPGDYSGIAAPLRIGEQCLGVLVLTHTDANRYGKEAAHMSATFSSYAAVAIENARLYESAHDQAWVSTVLLQVAEATQTLTTLNELAATIARITPMLVGVNVCAIYTLEEGNVFMPAAAAGLSPEGQEEFERWRFSEGNVPAFDSLLADRRPSVIRMADDDSLLGEIFSLTSQTEEAPNAQAESAGWIIVTPLQGRESLLGAFIVIYTLEPTSPKLEASFNEMLSIIQGVVQQTAMAIENIRLMKSQKEEAYVSVALLQVAQAVVSNNDLMDILGSIVRITPILVGIRRVAVFLWDEGEAQYTLAQGYGIPKGAEGSAFQPGAFPLLERVRQEDSLWACPLGAAGQAADVLEWWTVLPLPDLDEVQEVLESEVNLLLALPLSVKGQVVGVFLIEEPDTPSANGLPVATTNRRMRAKRLEITTGISQQAALAVQNDRFQRETVRRERLDREMQLAREIQRTFLPHSLPRLSGWDLDVYWRPAREVAGDFYDFFDLPGKRLGMVIADVADKGIPAALFMTLVRTLMRATVQQLADPAEVLAQVNAVLAPDADQGMFVTLFYAVLALETGELAYANAGHNPPLLFCQESGAVQRLEKGETALGVLPEQSFTSRARQLHAGDFLVLYTDGITEAFSPLDHMYGEEGLKQTIQAALENSQAVTAGELLGVIDESVQLFVGDTPPADDLTLLVLRGE